MSSIAKLDVMNAVAKRVLVPSLFRTRPAKRVLLITNIFPPDIGGPAVFIDRLAAELVRRGYRVTVVCSSSGVPVGFDDARSFTVRRVSLLNRELYEIKVRLVLFWEMLRHKTILVNGLESYVAQVGAIVRRHWVLKVVGDTVWETARNRGTTALDIDAFQQDVSAQRDHQRLIVQRNRIFRRARYVFAPSEYVRRMVVAWGVAPERTCTIRNGVAPNASAATSRTSDAIGRALQVLFVGRLTNWKGVETLLLALTELPNAAATVAGDGPQYPLLVELSRQLGLSERVRFVGRKSENDIRNLMMRADVLVLTSLYEGMSHTVLEAASLGCPSIVSGIGGNAELVVPEVDGLVIPPQDVAALRGALARMMEDSSLRQRLAEGARRMAYRYRIESTVDQVVALLATG